MAPAVWLFLAVLGQLTEGLSGQPSAAPPGLANSSHADDSPLEPGQRLQVRLVNGSGRCSGAVELRRGLTWEPACGAFWNRSAAEAVCRALGCGRAEVAQPTASPTPERPPAPDAWNASEASEARNATRAAAPAARCGDNGAEWWLCSAADPACSGGQLAHVTCAEDRALRLADGGSPCAGRVEMLERGQWGSVCDDAWGLEDAHVVCRHLGCGWAVEASPGLRFPPGRGPVHRDQVNCSGAEEHLWDCPGLPGQGYCGHKEDAGAVCSEHQSWRLTGGVDRCEGQVEVHFRGVWSTVCDSSWYSHESNVLCRTLGCGTMARVPRGRPHSLPGRLFYSCEGGEPSLSHCLWRFNNSNLCSQSRAARVLCSGSRSLLNLSTSEVPTSVHPATAESSVTAKAGFEGQELRLLIACIVLGILLLASLISVGAILLRVKGKYALPVMANHQHLPASTPAGVNNYQEVPNTIPKEEAPKLPLQTQALPPEDSDSDSDEDYEHYDFSSQPPVALTTFYNSQRHRPSDQEILQSRFQMPTLEEDTLSLGPHRQQRSNSGSSTSSGDNYCNSPSHGAPPRTPPAFHFERSALPQPSPDLELAGTQAAFPGPSADDGSSTSSGEGDWYQNYQPLPPPPSEEQFGYPGASGGGEGVGSPSPQPESTDDDYDDIGAA